MNKRDEYTYQPCDLSPPVGERLMTHWFSYPDHAHNAQLMAFLRTPKKRKEKLVIRPQRSTEIGWGIQIVEGWILGRLWLVAFLFALIGGITFAICWAVLEKDLQGAFAVSAFIVSLLVLGLGAVQTNLS